MAVPINPRLKQAVEAAKKRNAPKPQGITPAQQKAVDALAKATSLKDPHGQPAVSDDQLGRKPLNIRQIQLMLRKAGYDIAVDGQLGRITKAALADYLQPSKGHPVGDNLMNALKGTNITGKRNPDDFNAHYGQKPSVVSKPPKETLTPQGNPDMGGSTPPAAPANSIDFGGLNALATKTGSRISEGLADDGASLIDGSIVDKLMAAYNNAINGVQVDQLKAGRDADQSQTDIRNWYGQVQSAQKTAGTRDAAISKAGIGSVRDAGQSILASLGGAANEGSGMVGGAAEQAVGTLGALGSIQDQYNSDLAPLLKDEQAGAEARQSALSSANALTLAQKLADLQTEKGVQRAQTSLGIQQSNNETLDNRVQRLLGIKSANNQLDQQGFQNALALNAAQQSAILTGAKILGIPSGPYGNKTPPKVDLQKAANAVAGLLGVQGDHKLIQGTGLPKLVSTVKTYLQGQGLRPGDPIYTRVGSQLVSSFQDAQGKPLAPNPGWFNN